MPRLSGSILRRCGKETGLPICSSILGGCMWTGKSGTERSRPPNVPCGLSRDFPRLDGSWSIPRERERERESLTCSTNTTNTNTFSLIYYIYRKVPEPDSDRVYWLSTSVHYPFFYPFFFSRLLFPQEYTVVIENKKFSEKILFFSVPLLFVLCTELLLTMCPAWSAGVFFIYGTVLLPPIPDDLPLIRGPPLTTLRHCPVVMRDAHATSSTRLKRTFH